MRRVAIVVVLVGCGRWRFDARDDAGVTTGDSGEPVDSAFAPTTDAPATAVTRRLGECPNADVAGVTTDTFLDDGRPTENFGRRVEMRVGENRVSLIRFDLAAIPTTATIFSANLEIAVSPTDALEQGYAAISPVLEMWDEGMGDYSPGVCNWNERQGGVGWTTPGAGVPGSRTGAVMGTFTPSLESVRHDVPIDASVVQGWVGGTNGGMAIYGVNEGANGAWLATREATDPALRPCIRITYVP